MRDFVLTGVTLLGMLVMTMVIITVPTPAWMAYFWVAGGIWILFIAWLDLTMFGMQS